MRLLLDTHIFIWWNGNLDRLSPQARALCLDKRNTLILSLASIWEMQIKAQLGKLILDQPLHEIIEGQKRANGIEILTIATTHIYALQHLPPHHKDPFDRLLIAQANVEGIPVITADAAFRQYELRQVG